MWLSLENNSVERPTFLTDMVKICNVTLLWQDLWEIPWSLGLSPVAPYMYFIDGSKQQDIRLDYVFLAVAGAFGAGNPNVDS